MSAMAALPEMKSVESSNLDAIGHRGSTLWVRFKSGALYSYKDVPAALYHEFQAAESPGGFFRSKVRGHFVHASHDD